MAPGRAWLRALTPRGRAAVLPAYAAQLAVADREYRHGRTRAAAESFAEALRLGADRVLHFDAVRSPLATDPEGYTAPLRTSPVAAAVRAPRGRVRTSLVLTGSTSGGNRVLVATWHNANFLGELREHLDSSADYESRFHDFAKTKRLGRITRDVPALAEHLLGPDRAGHDVVEAELRAHLDWADVVFVEWCTALAVLVTMVDPGDTRVVVRLHSYEAFTHWPHLVDFSRVDVLLFVSEHLRDLAESSIPALREPGAPQLEVLPLGMDLSPMVRPKPADARFTLGLVGWGSVAKDPLWALEVLRLLRAEDPRYRLLLVGDEFDSAKSAATRSYAARLSEEVADLERAGAVRRYGRTDDVPAALTGVGVILSSSVRESFHAALVEGAASGAVPVVRDWPFFAGKPHGARTLFPADWVVATPEQAAARILAQTATEDGWRASGAAASSYAVGTWDWGTVQEGYDRLFCNR